MDLRRKNMKITSEMELDFLAGKVWTSRQYVEESLEDSHSLLETEKKWSLLVECTPRGDVLGN